LGPSVSLFVLRIRVGFLVKRYVGLKMALGFYGGLLGWLHARESEVDLTRLG